MSKEDNDGIIRPDFQVKNTLTVGRDDRVCRHRHIIVGRYGRTVECGDCKAKLDPFTVLLQYADDERSFHHLEKAMNRLSDNVEALKKEERRIKQRIARAKKRPMAQESLPLNNGDKTRATLDDLTAWAEDEISR